MRPSVKLIFACAVLSLTANYAIAQGGEGDRPRVVDENYDDLIHSGDIVDVDVLGGFEFDWRGTLTPDGFLDGIETGGEPIYALCRSEAAVAEDVAKILGKTLRDPKVVARILDRSNRAAARIEGAIRTPSRFQIKRRISLREILVMAGGLVDGASGDVSLYRPRDLSCRPRPKDAPQAEKDTVLEVRVIKLTDLLSGKTEADPQILSGDLITVARAFPIYIIGAVVNPRPVYSRESMTVSRLVATAGGVAKDGDAARVYIFRRDGAEIKSIEADLTKIKKGESTDEILRPFDIIEIASKGGGKRKYPPVTANDQNFEHPTRELPLRVVD